jgi:hypothetical protein
VDTLPSRSWTMLVTTVTVACGKLGERVKDGEPLRRVAQARPAQHVFARPNHHIANLLHFLEYIKTIHVLLAVVHWMQTEEIRNPPPQAANGRYHRRRPAPSARRGPMSLRDPGQQSGSGSRNDDRRTFRRRGQRLCPGAPTGRAPGRVLRRRAASPPA